MSGLLSGAQEFLADPIAMKSSEQQGIIKLTGDSQWLLLH